MGVFQFGEYRLDCDRFELCRAGRDLKLERKPMELLILLATKRGDLVSRDEIAERLWGGEVFVDTEHGINTAIRKIRYILRDDPEQPRFVQTVMGKGYRFVGSSIEEIHLPLAEDGRRLSTKNGGSSDGSVPVPAVPLSAVIQTPSVNEEVSGKSKTQHAKRRLWLAAAGVAALIVFAAVLIIGVRVVKGAASRAAPLEIHSLAVLPLDNLSGDKGQEYFADGMTDELTTMLAKDSTLRLISRTSVMQYKGVHRPLREIAQELGVDGVLEGSIERSGDKVHMTLQLIQGPSDTHVWAESYDRGANDLISLPDDAAMAIAKRTNSAVLRPVPARYVNPNAHDAYLHGRYLWYGFNNEEAGKYFKRAVELQPDYALAWSGLSDYYGLGMVDGEMDPREGRAPFEAAAQKAVDLDDSLPEAHNSLCAAFFFSQWDLARADRECVRAIGLDPKFAEAYHLRAKLLAALNRHAEAIESQKKASEIDPFSRPWALAYVYTLARQYDAALVEGRQRLESNPHDPGTLGVLAGIYRCKGMDAEAAQAWADSLAASGDQADAASIRRKFEKGGYHAVLLWNLANMKKQALKHYVSPVDMALQYAQLGEREQTLAQLEEAYRQHSPGLVDGLQDDPAYDFLHSDERYRSLIKRIGLPPAY
jgi:TolB-like protein/DNA-binding winged helix-turn-helix (wHTH) protein